MIGSAGRTSGGCRRRGGRGGVGVGHGDDGLRDGEGKGGVVCIPRSYYWTRCRFSHFRRAGLSRLSWLPNGMRIHSDIPVFAYFFGPGPSQPSTQLSAPRIPGPYRSHSIQITSTRKPSPLSRPSLAQNPRGKGEKAPRSLRASEREPSTSLRLLSGRPRGPSDMPSSSWPVGSGL